MKAVQIIKKLKEYSCEYEENLKRIVDENALKVGVLFDKIDKKDLFGYVSGNGALPRKTFSMGEGVEKRYYLEGRMIKIG